MLFCGVQSRELEPAWPLNLLMDCWRAIILQSRSRWKGELVIMTKTGMLSFAVLCGSAALAQTAAPKGQATSAVQSPPAAAPADSPGRKVASGHVSADYVFPYLSYYWSLPADRRSMFVPSYALTIDGHPPTGWSFFLKIGDTLKPIAVAPDGHIEELPTAQDLAGHPEVVMHVAPDQVGKRSISTNIGTIEGIALLVILLVEPDGVAGAVDRLLGRRTDQWAASLRTRLRTQGGGNGAGDVA